MFLETRRQRRQAFPSCKVGSVIPAPLRNLGDFRDHRSRPQHAERSLREGKIRFDPFYVRGMDDGRFCQMPFAFGIPGRHKMASGRMRAQHLALRGNLEPFGDGLSGFAARD